ncbi:hypothetical protein MHPYR_380028 [uncultured Mycobacterium sp.]|uniref:Uncharacterized protein n=1 Tax=uncultured Mycobacterium sp. TaxID=171292 RepID=A0A1Y5PHU9_9MYCO|nr:hypothetical protein MHPYR_380028 [uncultured Mycobacterium sp.]
MLRPHPARIRQRPKIFRNAGAAPPNFDPANTMSPALSVTVTPDWVVWYWSQLTDSDRAGEKNPPTGICATMAGPVPPVGIGRSSVFVPNSRAFVNFGAAAAQATNAPRMFPLRAALTKLFRLSAALSPAPRKAPAALAANATAGGTWSVPSVNAVVLVVGGPTTNVWVPPSENLAPPTGVLAVTSTVTAPLWPGSGAVTFATNEMGPKGVLMVWLIGGIAAATAGLDLADGLETAALEGALVTLATVRAEAATVRLGPASDLVDELDEAEFEAW